MSAWLSTSLLAAGWLMLFVGVALWSVPAALAVCGSLLIAAGVFAE